MTGSDRKVFGTLFFSIFAAVTGVGIVVPLLPVYAHRLGASGLYIGLIFGAFSISRTFFLPYFGRLSDRKGRKWIIVGGLLGYALISAGFVFAKNINGLILIRFIQGIASAMIMPVVQAYIGDITPQGREGFTMGMFNMSVFMGLSIGPLIGGAVNDVYGLDAAFGSLGVLAAVGFFFSLVLLPPIASEKGFRRQKPPAPWRWLLQDREIAALFVFRFAYTTCIGIIWSFLPVYADIEFSLSSALIGILVMLGVFISGVIHAPMGLLADRLNRKAMVLLGGGVTGAAIYAFTWAGGFWDLFAANILFGLGGGVAMPALMALAVLKGSQTDAMGAVMALLTMAHSLGMLTGALAGGLIMDLLKMEYMFVMGIAVMLAGVGLFAWLFKSPAAASAAVDSDSLPDIF